MLVLKILLNQLFCSFTIPPSGFDFIRPDIYLSMDVRIRNGDGTALADKAVVAPTVNANTYFADIEVAKIVVKMRWSLKESIVADRSQQCCAHE